MDSQHAQQQPQRNAGKRPPPIHIIGKSLKAIADLRTWKNTQFRNNFFLKQSRDTASVSIFPTNLEYHKVFKEILDNKNIEYYTYTPKNEKLTTNVLKGLFGNFSEKEIQHELNELNIENVDILKV